MPGVCAGFAANEGAKRDVLIADLALLRADFVAWVSAAFSQLLSHPSLCAMKAVVFSSCRLICGLVPSSHHKLPP